MEASPSTSRSGWVTLVAILFVIAGGFNLLWGVVALGVSLGGADAEAMGDLATEDLEGLGIAGVIVGGLQLFAGFGILRRATAARVVGLILAVVAVILNFAYYRVLEGWAFSGLVFNLGTIVILTLKRDEFA